ARMSTAAKRLRVAAVGDLHAHASGGYRDFFADVSRRGGVLGLCGGLTPFGAVAEAEGLAADLGACSIPVMGVLGKPYVQSGHAEDVRKILAAAKLKLLEWEPFEYAGVGFAGAKGFCGGFNRYMLTSFGEDAIKQFVNEAVNEALQLENSLRTLTTDRTVV